MLAFGRNWLSSFLKIMIKSFWNTWFLIKGSEKEGFRGWEMRWYARTHCVEGPDGVEVGFIWGVTKFGKCSHESLCLWRLAPVVVLQVKQMCHDVDGCGQGPTRNRHHVNFFLCAYFPGGSDSKVSGCSAGDRDSIPGLERSPGEGNGNPL